MEAAAQIVLEGGRGCGITATRLSWVRQCGWIEDVIWGDEVVVQWVFGRRQALLVRAMCD